MFSLCDTMLRSSSHWEYHPRAFHSASHILVADKEINIDNNETFLFFLSRKFKIDLNPMIFWKGTLFSLVAPDSLAELDRIRVWCLSVQMSIMIKMELNQQCIC